MFHRRLAGESLQYSFSPEAKKNFQEFLKDHSSSAPADGWEEHRESYPATIAKIALCVRLLREGEDLIVSVADLAIAKWVGRGLLAKTKVFNVTPGKAVVSGSRDMAQQSWMEDTDEDPLDGMLGKLRRLGPCTRRTLFRTYTGQNYERLVPILDRLITLGFVERSGKNYQVADGVPVGRAVNPGSASVSGLGE